MNDRDLRMILLDKSGADVEKAKVMYAWVTDVQEIPEPPPMPNGVMVTDAEILANNADELQKIAMKRLADRQNFPPPPSPPEVPAPAAQAKTGG